MDAGGFMQSYLQKSESNASRLNDSAANGIQSLRRSTSSRHTFSQIKRSVTSGSAHFGEFGFNASPTIVTQTYDDNADSIYVQKVKSRDE